MARVTVRQFNRDEARRIAIRAQLLDAARPRDLDVVVKRLTLLQIDPTSVVAPSADLVTWSRLGGSYSPAHLQQALERDRTLFEHRAQATITEAPVALIRPISDLGLFLGSTDWAAGGPRATEWMRANDAFRRRILDRLRDSGPLASRDIPDTSEVPWQSSGWSNDRNVTQMLELLGAHAETAVSARRGRERLWDLAERVYPAGVDVVPADAAHRIRDERWLRALGVARPKFVGDAGVPAEIEGTSGEWRVHPEATAEGFGGRTALLSPFDRLTYNRARTLDLFEFEYALEMYKPKEKRRWGYFALPILHGDQLVGKVDATADREASALSIHAIHQDVPFTRSIAGAVDAELQALARWLGLDGVRYR